MVTLPVPVPVAKGWQLADLRPVQRRSEPAADGLATIELQQLGPDEIWLVDHMVVVCDSTAPTVLRLYAGTVSPLALLDGSDSGNFDVAEWPTGLLVSQSTSLIAQWSGVDDGATAVLTLQARIMRRS
jgi:hypothetical protein